MFYREIHIFDIFSKSTVPILIKLVMNDPYDMGIDSYTNWVSQWGPSKGIKIWVKGDSCERIKAHWPLVNNVLYPNLMFCNFILTI